MFWQEAINIIRQALPGIIKQLFLNHKVYSRGWGVSLLNFFESRSMNLGIDQTKSNLNER